MKRGFYTIMAAQFFSSLADNALPYPGLSPLCAEALEARVICDMYEGNRPFTPRYVLPDYARL